MSEIGGRLKDNIFTDHGFAAIDDVVASALKRGRNGEGYGVDITLQSSGRVISMSDSQVETIRAFATDAYATPDLSLRVIATVIGQAIGRNT